MSCDVRQRMGEGFTYCSCEGSGGVGMDVMNVEEKGLMYCELSEEKSACIKSRLPFHKCLSLM